MSAVNLEAARIGNALDADEWRAESVAEILEGLTAPQKRISPKYFYDELGSRLFDEICNLPEYYPTRTEYEIMQAHLPEIAELVGPEAAVIELGAGSNAKARQLLHHLDRPIAYVPVEISGKYLAGQAAELQTEFPELSVQPVVADFTKPFDLPEHSEDPARNLVFFPGSTIGNFTRPDARELLEVMRCEAKPGGSLLIGVDLIKDIDVVLAAYNDSQGVTAAFNLNALKHLNETVGTDFAIESFEHEAIYDAEKHRIEMRLVSLKPQSVAIDGETIPFEEGEHIVTEYSHKYSVDMFRSLASEAGWSSDSLWVDDDRLFSVHFLTVPGES
ncbi:MAG TPA: L-histidine N(alpha)-methyltransferase [Gammaproteobacteria bacterium]|nr:L-histidine N(alpha)-methyltransferase [Gammaproteobacteria bacterium]